MIPRDALVVLAPEKLVGRNVLAREVVHIADEATIIGEPHCRGKESLRHAEGHVDLVGLAPLGHDVAVPDDETVQRRPHRSGADSATERLAGEVRELVVEREVLVRLGFLADGEVDGLLKLDRVHSELARISYRPVAALRKVGVLTESQVARDSERQERARDGDPLHH